METAINYLEAYEQLQQGHWTFLCTLVYAESGFFKLDKKKLSPPEWTVLAAGYRATPKPTRDPLAEGDYTEITARTRANTKCTVDFRCRYFYERRPRARCYPPPPYPLFATHLHFSANHGATRQPIVKTTHKNALGLKWCLRGHLRTWHESSCTKGSASPIWSEKVPTGLPILSMPSWPSELTLFPYVSKRAHMSNGKPTPNISPHHSGARTCGSYQP